MAATKSSNIDGLITQAAKKVGARKENDICRYLPGPSGAYIHHFTMRKMKQENPEQLAALINKHILNNDKSSKLPPKPRAARGSRKRRDQFTFTRTDIERLLKVARLAGDSELVKKLTPKRDLKTAKRELVSSVRHGRVEHELWQAYVDAVTTVQALPALAI